MGELADHIKLEQERKKRKDELTEHLKNVEAWIDDNLAVQRFLDSHLRDVNKRLTELRQAKGCLLHLLKELAMDEAPLANREKPETHRGVSID